MEFLLLMVEYLKKKFEKISDSLTGHCRWFGIMAQ
jgi:hypothetical protein